MLKPFFKPLIYVFLLLMATLGLATLPTGNAHGYLVFPQGSTYEKEWKRVDSLEKKGLFKSAGELTNAIYLKAKSDKNNGQAVKALLFRMKYARYMEENSIEKSIASLGSEIKSAPFPLKQVLHSILADTYWSYYQNNRWKFLNRSRTINFDPEDVATWDLQRIVSQTSYHYSASLLPADSLKRTSVETFKDILYEGTSDGRKLRPTLYDFLGHRAFDFFSLQEADLVKPAFSFSLNSEDYFAPAGELVRYKFQTEDTTSSKFKALLIVQSLIEFHLADKSPGALIDADLKRLIFVRRHASLEHRDSLYYSALSELESRFGSHPESAEVTYLKATYHYQQAQKYLPLQGEEFKWEKKKALDMATAAIAKYPASYGAQQCLYLSSLIKAASFDFKLEKVYPSGKPLLGLMSYTNVSKLYFKICPISPDKLRQLEEKYYDEELMKQIVKLVPEKQFTREFPIDGDFQNHKAEFHIPNPGLGHFVLVAGTHSGFSMKNEAVAYLSFSVSDISYLTRKSEEDQTEFRVLERTSGIPMEGVTAQLHYEKYNYTLRRYEYIKGEKLTSGKDGDVVFPAHSHEGRSFFVEFKKGFDVLRTEGRMYQYKRYKSEKYKSLRTFFFTDRAIYRPGQTIYFKGITLENDGDDNYSIKTGQKVRATLYDVNHREIFSQDFTTNEFGSYSGTFTAPEGVLNGNMQISDGHGNVYFSVEEYKQPRFEVKLNQPEGEFKVGDPVTVTGTALGFAGNRIDQASVKYRVVRRASFPWWCYWRGFNPNTSEVEITNGVITSNDTGGFVIPFRLLGDESILKSLSPTYHYQVFADVTDLNGETRSGNTYVTAALSSLKMETTLPGEISLEEAEKTFEVKTTNYSGRPVKTKGQVKIYFLSPPQQTYKERYWERPDQFTMQESSFRDSFPNNLYRNENDPLEWPRNQVFVQGFQNIVKGPGVDSSRNMKISNPFYKSNLIPGKYLIEINSVDKDKKPVKEIFLVDVSSSLKQGLPGNPAMKISLNKNIAEPGDTVKIRVGTRENSIQCLYEIEQEGKIVHSEWLPVNVNKQTFREIILQEKHRGNISVHFSTVRNSRVYTESYTISVPYTNKELDISFETFRDKLYPGTKESWKLKIKGKKGEKAMAEMLASMYDASLDAFRANSWYFQIYKSFYGQMGWWNHMGFGQKDAYVYDYNWNPHVSHPYRTYDRINWFGSNAYRYGYYYDYENTEGDYLDDAFYAPLQEEQKLQTISVTTGARREKSKDGKMANADAPAPSGDLGDETVISRNLGGTLSPMKETEKKNSGGEDKSGLEKVKARSNFAETAFFYPHLSTDAEGNTVISFTLPESLTKWKVMTFAHTKDLKFGFATKELVTRKDLMVIPNPPRFFRENDKIVLAVKINNLSDRDLEGKAKISFTDPITGKDMSSVLLADPKSPKYDNQQKSFSMKKGLSTMVSWEVNIPEGVGALSYKVVAVSDNFSDGEERPIPVLTNRMLVTETMPLPIRGKQQKTFSFDKMISSNGGSNTLKHHKLTLEFTSNPAWYAVQSLPYLMEYPYECAEQTFSRFYANSIASHIANSSPKIKAVFDSWKMSSPDAFLSNLQKNQELKSLLLEETPWVLEAKDESERKKRVGLLFDLNKMSAELSRALTKLQKMQASNGGWPWFEGMPDDRYITQHIITGMGHLDHLGVKDIRVDYNTWRMVQKGLKYLDNRIDEDYDWIVKHDKANMDKNHLGYYHIQYLYARSYFKDVPINSGNKKAFDYFLGQAKKYWLENGRYMQGMIALALHRYDDKKTPQDIMKSLKETAIVNEEMGMYWKDNYPSWYWYQAPIETQALLIEAFDEVSGDKKVVDDLKVWLLKSKQTQNWKTTKATTEAVYALLLRGTDWLATESMVEIIVGDMKIDPKKMDDVKVEAGTGYFKTSWSGGDIKPNMGKVTVTKKDEGVSWGAMYWQYFEQLDKITPAETPLKLKKKLFVERSTAKGPVIEPVTEKTKLKVGDKIKVRIELRVDRDMEYVHMKDMRSSGFEPVNVFSGYRWQDGLGYYESTKDAATNFFFGKLNKGTYVFEYPLFVSHKGDFSNGITSIQCMYAPEFTSHSEGIRVKVE